ncbi:MAG: alpha-glucan family phosphorylase [Proteobacteria bacterium]|nr:alpha-glucan family phosphorylase [Pseudomonadota bacterium]MBU0965093.1 alpha-glucan family phosphorylase [Pseudomonadota bacterium]
MNPERYLPRSLPARLKGLTDLALDLRWSWNHSADKLWQKVDAELWELSADPWLILESISRKRLDELAVDAAFVEELQQQLQHRESYLGKSTWFTEKYGQGKLGNVAYFSMEFGLTEALPIYSGGLGVLAGDFLKTASDLGLPVIGIGLMYQQGYFHQAFDTNGDQLAFFPYNNPTMLPVLPLRNADGEWLRVSVELPGRTLQLRGWQAQVGRIPLYLLDSNDLLNSPGDRGITGELYGGGMEMRLQQEMVLGIGGWLLLEALHIDCCVCHLNEGHAAFAVLERARSFMEQSGQPFDIALRGTRAGNIFTTHTPVEAGFDRFPRELMAQYFSLYAGRLGISLADLLDLGRAGVGNGSEPFNMAYLAFNGCGRVNGVSRLHGEVSRSIFRPLFPRWPEKEIPVGHVTNGVHVPSWDSAAADDLWTRLCGRERWMGILEDVEHACQKVSDEKLWEMRSQARLMLIKVIRRRLARQRATCGNHAGVEQCVQQLDPNALTICFARRFASYKRPALLLADPRRLMRLLTNIHRPVQLIIAGKAHPEDKEGRRLVRQWNDFLRRPEVQGHVVFIQDYDMAVAAELVQGADLWLNTPRRPWEASGTSGMKVLVNGGLNLSELDGWWPEAYRPELGWALGDGKEHEDHAAWDSAEAEVLYTMLEQDIIPAFYNRDGSGIPTSWVARMRESMAQLTNRFSCNRMMREYIDDYYLPAAEAYGRRVANNTSLAVELEKWHDALAIHWPHVRFGQIMVHESAGDIIIRVEVYFTGLAPETVHVELFAEPAQEGNAPERISMARGDKLAGSEDGYLYYAVLPADGRPTGDYTPRLIPSHPDALVPLEANFILWYS